MALKKKDDGFEALRLEAHENGINLAKAEDGTFTASVVGGHTLDSYASARAVLDDMLALIEMDSHDGLYAYDNGPMGGYQVSVTGGGTFEDDSVAGAFAKAKESVVAKAQPKSAAKVVAMPKRESKQEVLEPVKPNGEEKAQMAQADLRDTLANGLLDIAARCTDLATALRGPAGAIPFVQEGFAEAELANEPDSPPPARTRVSRERKKGA